jgi:3-hydroxyisobutyrate dehydrogenase-like beta-hydroxyacid dehydrogenase
MDQASGAPIDQASGAPIHRVGVIGLGQMGLPIAVNLIGRGFQVTGYRRSGSPELQAAGGTVGASAAEVAAGADVLLSIVPTAEDVEEIITGPAGTLKTAKEVFDKALADGWGDLDIACVHDQVNQ